MCSAGWVKLGTIHLRFVVWHCCLQAPLGQCIVPAKSAAQSGSLFVEALNDPLESCCAMVRTASRGPVEYGMLSTFTAYTYCLDFTNWHSREALSAGATQLSSAASEN